MWGRDFDRWLAPFWDALGNARRRWWGPVYVGGLLAKHAQERGALAAAVAPGYYAQVHHFVNAARWADAPLERVLAGRSLSARCGSAPPD